MDVGNDNAFPHRCRPTNYTTDTDTFQNGFPTADKLGDEENAHAAKKETLSRKQKAKDSETQSKAAFP